MPRLACQLTPAGPGSRPAGPSRVLQQPPRLDLPLLVEGSYCGVLGARQRTAPRRAILRSSLAGGDVAASYRYRVSPRVVLRSYPPRWRYRASPSIQIWNTFSVAARTRSLVLATSKATVAIGHASW